MDCDPITFSPPLYIQRDEKINEIISFHKDVIHILEVGCGECRLINRLKQSHQLQKIIGIDMCRSSLENNFFKLKPLSWDFIQRRKQPLLIELYLGDILKLTKEFSKSLEHQILILTEVIEHLLIEDLDQLAHSLFHTLSPPILIISTPNFEFNVCFEPNENRKFRHYDHKFEWTRAEFQEWCNAKASEFGYSVSYDGVGDPPANRSSIGFCTQFSIFHKLHHPHSNDACKPYYSFTPCYLYQPGELTQPPISIEANTVCQINETEKVSKSEKIDNSENIKNSENIGNSSYPQNLMDSRPLTDTSASTIPSLLNQECPSEQSFELIVRIEYPYKERVVDASIMEVLVDAVQWQAYLIQTKYSLQDEDGAEECVDNENVQENNIGEDNDNKGNSDNNKSIGNTKLDNNFGNSDKDNNNEEDKIDNNSDDINDKNNTINMHGFSKDEEAVSENSFIGDGYAFICIDTLFQEKNIQEYFEGNLSKFKHFLKINSFLLEETGTYVKHLIEETNSDCETIYDEDEHEKDEYNIQDGSYFNDINININDINASDELENWD